MPVMLAQNNLLDALVLTGVGMGVVFAALLLLMLMIGGLHRAVGERPKPTAPKPAASTSHAPKPTKPAKASSSDDLPSGDELIAVLTAAAAVVLGQPTAAVRVLRFRQSSDDWATAGRGSLTRSHRPSRSSATPTASSPASPPASPRSRRL